MKQIARNLTNFEDGFLNGKCYFLMDRDSKFCESFRDFLSKEGVELVRLPAKSPNLNAHLERFMRTIKSECVDRMIFFGENMLRTAVSEFLSHYHQERNQQGLENKIIDQSWRADRPRLTLVEYTACLLEGRDRLWMASPSFETTNGTVMRFSLRRLFGFITLGCVALGAILAFGPQSEEPAEVLRGCLAVILVVEAAAALYAACDPWGGYPTKLDKDLAQASVPRFHSGPVTRTLSVLVGVLFLILGGFGSMLFVDNNLSMDSGGASIDEWVQGSGLIAATCIGSYARGAALVGFIALLCGSPLGGRWAAVFGLCGGSLIALLVWRLTGDLRGITAGIVSLLLLSAGWMLAVRWVGRNRTLGRRARCWGARGFFLGLIAGATIATIPAVGWMLFWRSPTSLLLGATIGSGLGATLGMLAGVSDNSSLRVESQPTAPPGERVDDG